MQTSQQITTVRTTETRFRFTKREMIAALLPTVCFPAHAQITLRAIDNSAFDYDGEHEEDEFDILVRASDDPIHEPRTEL